PFFIRLLSSNLSRLYFSTLSLHAALPILEYSFIDRIPSFMYALKDHTPADYILMMDKAEFFYSPEQNVFFRFGPAQLSIARADGDRKSKRLNSSHVKKSYAVFCL